MNNKSKVTKQKVENNSTKKTRLKASDQILIDGAKKIISIAKDPYDLFDFIFHRLLNSHYYEVKNPGSKQKDGGFSPLWCMMYDIVLPLIKPGSDMVKEVAEGIESQRSATDKPFSETIVSILTSMKADYELGGADCRVGFATLLTLQDIIKDYSIQLEKEKQEEKKVA